MNVNKPPQGPQDTSGPSVPEAKRGYSSWWYWRRSGDKHKNPSPDSKENIESRVGGEPIELIEAPALLNQHTPPRSISVAIDADQRQSKQHLGKTIDLKHNLSSGDHSEHLEFNRSVSISDETKTNELYRKSLRLTTDQIVCGHKSVFFFQYLLQIFKFTSFCFAHLGKPKS